MKDTIKEIIDKLKNSSWENDEEFISYKTLFYNEVYELLDYITSLEQANKNTYETSQDLLSEMQLIIDKAIEYINDDLKDYHTITSGSANDLLKILKGE